LGKSGPEDGGLELSFVGISNAVGNIDFVFRRWELHEELFIAALLADVVPQRVVRRDQQPRQYGAIDHSDIAPPTPSLIEDHSRHVLSHVREPEDFYCVPPHPMVMAVEKHPEGVTISVDNPMPQHLIRYAQFLTHTP
jgi:hypothetical protein